MTVFNVEAVHKFCIRGAVTSPIRVFNLKELGEYDESSLRTIVNSYKLLSYDAYDPALKAEKLVTEKEPSVFLNYRGEWSTFWENELAFCNSGRSGVKFWQTKVTNEKVKSALELLQPHRRRAAYKYLITPKSKFELDVQEIGCPSFLQKVSDIRARPRQFHSINREIRSLSYFQWLIAVSVQLVIQTRPIVSEQFYVTAHQMKTYAIPGGGEPAPEGLHQDGVPYIVSGIVMERQNVTGGINRVYYGKGEALAIERKLKVGEGIFQADTENGYYHSISPIYRLNSEKSGYRSILGLDIEFVD